MSRRHTIALAAAGTLLTLTAIEATRFVVECVAILITGADLGETDT